MNCNSKIAILLEFPSNGRCEESPWVELPAAVAVAAGGRIEATEKLYERHYLVIKIVSSFFACLIKFLYL